MTIWSTEIKELERLHDSFKGHLPDLEKELERLLKTDDENMVLLYARRCLEVIITDLCEHELRRPRKTEPLKGIIDKLNREEKVPPNIITSMDHLNSLSAFGVHPKDFDMEQVKPVLNNLATIIKWYLKYKEIQSIGSLKSDESKHEIKEPVIPKESKQKPKKKLIVLLSGLLLVATVVIVVLLVLNIIGGKKQTKELEKSIAVLPFLNDSPDEENSYFINGLMDEILINLQKIKDLRVISRNSVEQYRGQAKPSTPEIAKKLDVNYIVEGSGQKYGNSFRLRVQLIEAVADKHLWAESYEREIKEASDIFGIQSQIAQIIATELKAVITPEEKQLIEKKPTANLVAYDFYQRGRDEYSKGNLEKAKSLFQKALEYDSEFAQAYTGLAKVYWDKHYFSEYFSENFIDSVLILTDIALSIDDQLAEAFTIKGNYFYETGNPEQAIKECEKAIKLNPNDWVPYDIISTVYSWGDDLLKAIENCHKAISLNKGPELPWLYEELSSAYFNSGFIEKANYYSYESLKLDFDSVRYYDYLAGIEDTVRNLLKSYALDSTQNWWTIKRLGEYYMSVGQYKESLKYYKKIIELLQASGYIALWDMQRIGYVYWKNGFRKEADYYFNKHIEYCNNEIKLGRLRSKQLFTYYDLAGIYAFRGEKDKAYENLRIFNQRQREPLWILSLIKTDPLFDSIRNEPEFQQIVRDVEAKYQAEHERVRKWLEEQGA